MKLLAIESSCDETAVAVLDCSDAERGAAYRILGNALLSQIDVHRAYGGVYPTLAKREHAKNFVPVLASALEEAELVHESTQTIDPEIRSKVGHILEREPLLAEMLLEWATETETPDIDAIAVTAGPGLSPALWVGVNLAKALSLLWNKPLVSVNHMEGHIFAALAEQDEETLTIAAPAFPALALLISGGHTELVLVKDWLSYELVGRTRDDAVGEAFDKVARLLGLPYPGGPEIARIAALARAKDEPSGYVLPRPMVSDNTCDFSFAGLKTAVLYLLKGKPEISEDEKQKIAYEFEEAVAETLWKKTARALEQTGAKTLLIGGGVSANERIAAVFAEELSRNNPDVSLHIPPRWLTTDNAVMIGLAGYFHARKKEFADIDTLKADGNLVLA